MIYCDFSKHFFGYLKLCFDCSENVADIKCVLCWISEIRFVCSLLLVEVVTSLEFRLFVSKQSVNRKSPLRDLVSILRRIMFVNIKTTTP